MLFDIIFFILGSVLNSFGYLLPSFTIWPDSVYDGLEFFATTIAKLNFILPIDTFFTCLEFLILFLSIYYSTRLFVSIINWIRGAGGINV